MEHNPYYANISFNEVENKKVRRRELLPWWIKAFVWFFMAIGAIVPIGVIIGLLGYNFSISLYGFETLDPNTLTGIFLIALYLIKAVTAFGLWTEKKWAVDLGIIDAIIGLVVCGIAMVVLPLIDTSEGFVLKLRLEPILLILYLLKLQKIKLSWKEEE
ncbi:hypothetical protein [Pontibacter rugosus]|uniref:Uncharacterized protein n=1 Tax=Pontibacter rugosus TaxID=1745966 RepID=A0ABW3ST88_9BACT